MSLKKGLVLDLDISSEGLQGTTKFKDKTPYENNGTFSNVTLTTDHKGKANSAGLFNGTDSYIDCGNKGLDFGNNQTISFWINTSENSSSYKRIIATDSENIYPYTIGLRNSKIEFTDKNNDGKKGFPIILNQWNHIVIIPGGLGDNSCSCFLNGLSINPTETTGGYNFSNRTSIGSRNNVSGTFFTGSIERPQIWNRALSADEVKLLYESYNPSLHIDSLQKGLVGHWTMAQDSLKGSLLADKTPYENDGTIYGATFTTDRMGKANSAMSFDGVDDYIDCGNDESLDFGTSDFTIYLWAKKYENIFKEYQVLLSKGTYKNYGEWILYEYRGNNHWNFYGDSGKRVEFDANIGSSWGNIVIIRKNDQMHIYFNAEEVTITSDSVSGANVNYTSVLENVRIGTRSSFDKYFNGLIDDVRIYNRALSEEEITKLYESYNK